MNDQKMFRKFLETWHTFSAPKVIFLIFGVKRENFLMGLKIDFCFEILNFWSKIPICRRHLFFRWGKFIRETTDGGRPFHVKITAGGPSLARAVL